MSSTYRPTRNPFCRSAGGGPPLHLTLLIGLFTLFGAMGGGYVYATREKPRGEARPRPQTPPEPSAVTPTPTSLPASRREPPARVVPEAVAPRPEPPVPGGTACESPRLSAPSRSAESAAAGRSRTGTPPRESLSRADQEKR